MQRINGFYDTLTDTILTGKIKQHGEDELANHIATAAAISKSKNLKKQPTIVKAIANLNFGLYMDGESLYILEKNNKTQ
ncbi:3261_t:CDS:2 [Ambispora gerdemannii]|uniref:3261_t:CDS:1 n=1 Tax=Ambispora gerdemannii TaxID=144530 RepID=A0A9N8VAW9_9GLOM|nr:3261_t:CDS:2 [Ambispora gerdemannii]